MAKDGLNRGTDDCGDINGVSAKLIDQLNDEELNALIAGHNTSKAKDQDGGWFGKVFGANTKNASIHIAFVVCFIMLLFCGFDLNESYKEGNSLTSEIWDLIFPVITLALGYIFGKGE